MESKYCSSLDKRKIIEAAKRYTPTVIRDLFTQPTNDKKKQEKHILFSLIKTCGKFGINSISINESIKFLCCVIRHENISDIVYAKSFSSPELIQQQYFLFIKEKIDELSPTHTIGDYHSQYIEVHFLADSVVAFKIYPNKPDLPPIEWKSTGKINWLST